MLTRSTESRLSIFSPSAAARALLLAASFVFGFNTNAGDLKPLVTTLMRDEQELAQVRFADVIEAATGKKIIPLGTNSNDRALVEKISHALDAVLARMNAADSLAQKKRRINEVSSLFEDAIKAELNKVEGFACDFPRTANGAYQRSGYPDLKLVEKATGRVAYLDPKLFERGSRASSFRTFYFEPKKNTNKVLDNAHHFIVGIEHDGKAGAWQFTRWELIDLANFRVKLKAEFQASNREMYRPEAVVASGTNVTAETQKRKE
jgi:hypothetical protein